MTTASRAPSHWCLRAQIESLVTGTSKSHQRAPAHAVFSLETVIPPTKTIEVFDMSATSLINPLPCVSSGVHARLPHSETRCCRLVSGEVRVGVFEQDA